MNDITQISMFEGNQIRRTFYENEWWFSVVDVAAFLTGSSDAGAYWRKLKQRLTAEGAEIVNFCHALKLTSSDGKKYKTDCANTEGIFRIIQSIPSPKAEPFKLWLAKTGKERIDEIENPELAVDRVQKIYEKKGYNKDWIDKRMRSISIRQKLTSEWSQRGANKPSDYATLTNDIMQGAFDLKVQEHKEVKSLKKENLRDHMTDLELIVAMLGEATTTEITKQKDSQGLTKLSKDAKAGGAVAGRARRDIEKHTGKKVVSKENFLPHQNSDDKKLESMSE